MTRENLIDEITKNVATEFRFSDLTEIIDSGVTEFIIDEVLLNFESRTCENCKYIGEEFTGKYGRNQWNCDNYIGYDVCTYTNRPYVIPTFGCKEWEPKDE